MTLELNHELLEAAGEHYDIAGEVYLETNRQLEKWNVQHHPDGTFLPGDVQTADVLRRRCDQKAKAGRVTWRDILDEEVAEAYAEHDPEKLATELIQVAAVAVSWVRDIRSRQTSNTLES